MSSGETLIVKEYPWLSPSPAIAFGITGMPSHSFDGFPDGIFKTGAEGVSVDGIGVFVGVSVGSGVLVEVGKLVSVGFGVSVGLGVKVLHAANARTRTESMMVLPMVFIYFLTCVQCFIISGW